MAREEFQLVLVSNGPGELYTWVATESALSRKVRRVLLDTHGLNDEFVKAVGYWRLDDSPEE